MVNLLDSKTVAEESLELGVVPAIRRVLSQQARPSTTTTTASGEDADENAARNSNNREEEESFEQKQARAGVQIEVRFACCWCML